MFNKLVLISNSRSTKVVISFENQLLIFSWDSRATRCVPTCEERVEKKIQCGKRPLLSSFVGSLKAAVTRYAHSIAMPFAWQTRYHDHAIRGVDDCNKIAAYIDNNVANWKTDCFYVK